MLEEKFRAATCTEVIRILSNARKAQGLSMNALAKKTGLSQPAISILESSQPNPKLDSLLKIARALDLNLGEILQQALRNVEHPTPSIPTSSRKRRD